jgi:uncharacterized protein (UPF0332 family)
MSFEWTTYFELSKVLRDEAIAKEHPLAEAKLRSAISRAYYAAHHQSLKYVEATQKGVYIGRTGKAHREVVDYLKASKKNEDRMAGNLLDRVLIAREKADYRRPFPGNVKAAAQAALNDAEKVLKAVVVGQPAGS